MTFSGIIAIIKLIPEFIAAVKEILKLIDAGEHYIEVKIALTKFDQAAQKAEHDKDTSDLENIFNPKPAPPSPPASGNH